MCQTCARLVFVTSSNKLEEKDRFPTKSWSKRERAIHENRTQSCCNELVFHIPFKDILEQKDWLGKLDRMSREDATRD